MASINPGRRRLRRRFVAVAVAGIIGVGSVTALAYFLTHGFGSSSIAVTVGGAPAPVPISLSLAYTTRPALTPGGAPDTIEVDASNANAVPVEFSLTPVIKTDGTGIYDTTSSSYKDACKASWFTVALTTGGTDTLPAHATSTQVDELTVTLIDSGSDQSACEGLVPEVDISAS